MGPPYPFSKSVSVAPVLALTAAGLYHAAVRRLLRQVFAQLNRGEWPNVPERTSEDVHHVFAGDHALGGERHSREAMGRCFERALRTMADAGIDEAGAPPITG